MLFFLTRTWRGCKKSLAPEKSPNPPRGVSTRPERSRSPLPAPQRGGPAAFATALREGRPHLDDTATGEKPRGDPASSCGCCRRGTAHGERAAPPPTAPAPSGPPCAPHEYTPAGRSPVRRHCLSLPRRRLPPRRGGGRSGDVPAASPHPPRGPARAAVGQEPRGGGRQQPPAQRHLRSGGGRR